MRVLLRIVSDSCYIFNAKTKMIERTRFAVYTYDIVSLANLATRYTQRVKQLHVKGE